MLTRQFDIVLFLYFSSKKIERRTALLISIKENSLLIKLVLVFIWVFVTLSWASHQRQHNYYNVGCYIYLRNVSVVTHLVCPFLVVQPPSRISEAEEDWGEEQIATKWVGQKWKRWWQGWGSIPVFIQHGGTIAEIIIIKLPSAFEDAHTAG